MCDADMLVKGTGSGFVVFFSVLLSGSGTNIKETQVTGRRANLTLICDTGRALTHSDSSHTWLKNGRPLPQATGRQSALVYNSTAVTDCCSCPGEDCEATGVFPHGQTCLTVTHPAQEACGLVGSTITISSRTSVRGVLKGEEESAEESPGYCVKDVSLSGLSILRISDLREKDEGQYHLRVKTQTKEGFESFPGTTLFVTQLRVTVFPVLVAEGHKVTLTCMSTCTLSFDPTYVWYKYGELLTNSSTEGNLLYMHPISREDTGSYSCAVAGHEHLLSLAADIRVRYGPRNTSLSASPPGALTGVSWVNLTCSSDANLPVDEYTWYRQSREGQPRVLSRTTGSYFIPTSSQEGGDQYFCEAVNELGAQNSTPFLLTSDLEGGEGPELFSMVILVFVSTGLVMVVVMAMGALVIYTLRKLVGGSDGIFQLPDPGENPYTAIDLSARSPDYDTLFSGVKDEPIYEMMPIQD